MGNRIEDITELSNKDIDTVMLYQTGFSGKVIIKYEMPFETFQKMQKVNQYFYIDIWRYVPETKKLLAAGNWYPPFEELKKYIYWKDDEAVKEYNKSMKQIRERNIKELQERGYF